MGVYSSVVVKLVCNKPQTNQKRSCFYSSIVEVYETKDGLATHNAKTELRALGWIFDDKHAICPNCARNLVEKGENPDKILKTGPWTR